MFFDPVERILCISLLCIAFRVQPIDGEFNRAHMLLQRGVDAEEVGVGVAGFDDEGGILD